MERRRKGWYCSRGKEVFCCCCFLSIHVLYFWYWLTCMGIHKALTPGMMSSKNIYIFLPSNVVNYLNLLSMSMGLKTSSNWICNSSHQFQNEIQQICCRDLGSLEYPKVGPFTLLLCRGQLRNLQIFITQAHSHCSAPFYSLSLDALVAVVVCFMLLKCRWQLIY